MASKGQKFNKYTPEFRADIVSQYINENKSCRYLAKTYGISEETIKTWIRKHKHGNSVFSDNCIPLHPIACNDILILSKSSSFSIGI